MKAFIAVAALVAAAVVDASPAIEGVSASLVNAALNAKWSSFKAKHGKNYAAHEESAKKAVFLKNTITIEEHNARFHQGLESFEMGHNEVSDLTHEEIKATRKGLQLPENIKEIMANASMFVPSIGYPADSYVDWRTKGAVTPVKNQGGCGSCYAFASVGAIEGAHFRKYGKLIDISEQDIVDCSSRYGNNGCDGGFMTNTYQWMMENGGYVSQASYPYTGQVGQCRHNSVQKIGKVTSYGYVQPGDAKALENAVATIGPMAVALYASSEQFDRYQRGILDIPNCSKQIDHGVVIVGYGNEGGMDFWILKNSWGTGRGEGGYYRIRKGVDMCGVESHAYFPLV